MPWVRLHAVKGYLDMISVLSDYPGVRVNFNLTPVLMLQIEELVNGSVRDLWLEWSRKRADLLLEEERLAILEHFFKIHHDNLLRPYPRYAELLNKRGAGFYRDKAQKELLNWTDSDFRDLQTWYNLAWCGYTAERLFPELRELKSKGRDFTEEEKNRVLDIHIEILSMIAPLYSAAEQRGQAELTTTPFFHPILPLVYDSDFAERCMPGRARPSRFHWPQDALAQLKLAVAQHTRMFGRGPRGLWPSEGSIAPELVPLMRDAGIEYFCSDEENLFNSLRLSGEHPNHLELFQGWKVEHEHHTINAIFREKPLSDFVGFMAWRNEPFQAAQHLLSHFRHLADQLSSGTGLIPVILDGENCWEQFKDGGEAFLRNLYAGLESDSRLRSCTVEDYLRRCPPKRTIKTLHSGSWIYSNFDIWIGDEEENRGWDLLGQTRQYLESKLHLLSESTRDAALREIYAAEGSDWFWWYGPDFSTECDVLFDELFRQHLKNVYALCGDIPPATLDRPVIGDTTPPLYRRPSALISPSLNGLVTPYFKWSGAGSYVAGSEQGAMFRDDRFVHSLDYGFNPSMLYIRIHLKRGGELKFALTFHSPTDTVIVWPHAQHIAQGPLTLRSKKTEQSIGQFAVANVVEIEVPFDSISAEPGSSVQFQLKLYHDGIERECYPEAAPIEFFVPIKDTHLMQWRV
jgi:alpha-amylase/alpha-mannosidase (GH57 family)